MHRLDMPYVYAMLGCVLIGCYDNVSHPFPPGLEPLEETNLATPPVGTDADPYPEEIRFFRTHFGGMNAVHARAYVHASVQDSFSAISNPLSGTERKSSVEFTLVDEREPDIMADINYKTRLKVHDVITVDLEFTWRHSIIERDAMGTAKASSTRWQKTWGSSVITHLCGSIVARRINDNVTALEMIHHLDAIGQDHGKSESVLRDYYVSILALTKGQPLPPQ